jgi:kynurenine 3-monooxygenase
VDIENGIVTVNGQKIKAKLIVGADGAHSVVRTQMLRPNRMEFSQMYIPHGYIEILLPSKDDKFQLEEKSLHIWPKHEYMLMALPNLDKSFTCTLFLDYEQLKVLKNDENSVLELFKSSFPDFLTLIGKEELISNFKKNPIGSLVSIKCKPYNYKNKVVIIGDAAHAMVPFCMFLVN